jgi:hypothetical protein
MERIQDCVEALGHAPIYPEFAKITGITKWQICREFPSWTEALRESGYDPKGSGYVFTLNVLFHEWAGVVRQVNKIPSIQEYSRRSGRGIYALQSRFGGWKKVPAAMRDFAVKKGLEAQWQDVMEIIDQHIGWREKVQPAAALCAFSGQRRGILEGRPVYGPPLTTRAMVSGPTSEAGVLVLLGMMAKELGFHVMKVQGAFPDCEVLYEVAPGKWQLLKIEVEYESRNFLLHGHDPAGCDMIVCWVHNWEECPLRVVELSKYF